jgi:uncharacterized protein (DUF3084 family)
MTDKKQPPDTSDKTDTKSQIESEQQKLAEREKKIQQRLEELRKRDPFIYR